MHTRGTRQAAAVRGSAFPRTGSIASLRGSADLFAPAKSAVGTIPDAPRRHARGAGACDPAVADPR
jgi:hypothetical protein